MIASIEFLEDRFFSLIYSPTTEVSSYVEEQKNFASDVVHGVGIWFPSFSPIFSARRCITFVVSGAPPPVHEISETKLLFGISRMRCRYCSFFQTVVIFVRIWWCFWRFGWRVKDFHIKEASCETMPHRLNPFIDQASFFFSGWLLVKAFALQRLRKRLDFHIVAYIIHELRNGVLDFVVAQVYASVFLKKQVMRNGKIVTTWTIISYFSGLNSVV